MKPVRRAIVPSLLLLLAVMAGCRSQPAGTGDAQIMQYSTLQTLIEGVYDGQMSVAQLKAAGDAGIGTFNGLDGELVMFDGHVYQVRADGSVHEVPDGTLVPFANVTKAPPGPAERRGDPVQPGLGLAALESLAEQGPDRNYPCLVLVEGTFTHVKTRSVPRQTRPYPKLTEVVKQQAVFERSDVEGVVVGFYLPGYLAGVNVTGLHLHFLSRDRTFGGHVLGFTADAVRVTVAPKSDLRLVLPTSEAFAEQGGEVTRDDIHAVEKQQ